MIFIDFGWYKFFIGFRFYNGLRFYEISFGFGFLTIQILIEK